MKSLSKNLSLQIYEQKFIKQSVDVELKQDKTSSNNPSKNQKK
jgi:hypothetical protein